MSDGTVPGNEPEGRRRGLPSFGVVLLVLLGILAVLWLAPTIAAFAADLDFSSLPYPYLVIFSFVVFDAVFPIFPSESLLTAASTLAAQSGSTIELWKVIVAGALGAVVGDTLLYWLSRTVLRRSMAAQVAKAQRSPRVARSLTVMSGNAPLIIVFGRFVPGIRFMVGATMGISRYPFRRFLPYNIIGGVFWASYTCLFSYLVGSLIDDKPVMSIIISSIVTTGLLALMYKPLKRSWEESGSDPDAVPDPTPASAADLN